MSNEFRVGLKSVLFVFLFAAVCFPVVAGGQKEKPKAAPDGPYRFTYTYGWDLAQGAIPPDKAPEDPHFQYIEKKHGIVPLVQPYDWNGGVGYEQAVRLQMSGGKIPEALQVFSEGFLAELITSGVLIPLDDLLPKYAPNTWKQFTAEDLALMRSFSPDNKIYFIAWKDIEPRAGMIRKDWLTNVGIDKVPSTVEELLAAFEAFKAKDANGNGDPNDEMGVAGREMLRWMDDLFVMHGVAMHEGHPQWRWNEAKKQFVSDQVSDEMKNAVTFIRMMYEKGYLDKNTPLNKSSDQFAKIERDTVGEYFGTISGLERRLAMKNPGKDGKALNPNAKFVYLPNVKVGNLPRQKNYAGGLTLDMAITIKAQDPAKILQWYDWCWTPEGTTYKFFGIEGLNYKKDENGKIVIDKTVTALSNKYPYSPRSGGRTKEIYADMVHGDQMKEVFMAAINDAQFLQNKFMPISVYADYDDYQPSTAPLYRERISKMIVGELPMSAWDDYVKDWYAKGGTAVTERATKWYKTVHKIK